VAGDTPEHFRGLSTPNKKWQVIKDAGVETTKLIYCALAQYSTNSFAGAQGLKLRAQIVSLRWPRVADPDHHDRIDAHNASPRFPAPRNADVGRHHLADRIEIPQPARNRKRKPSARCLRYGSEARSNGNRRSRDPSLLKIDLTTPAKSPRRAVTSINRSSLNRNRSTLSGSAWPRAQSRDPRHRWRSRGNIRASRLLDVDVDRECSRKNAASPSANLGQTRGVGEQMPLALRAGVSRKIAAHRLHIVEMMRA